MIYIKGHNSTSNNNNNNNEKRPPLVTLGLWLFGANNDNNFLFLWYNNKCKNNNKCKKGYKYEWVTKFLYLLNFILLFALKSVFFY